MHNLRSIVRDGLGSISRRSFGPWRRDRDRSGSCSDFTDIGLDVDDENRRSWAGMPPELLREVVKRLERGGGGGAGTGGAAETAGAAPTPAAATAPSTEGGKHVVAFASVCRSWRRVCKEVVGVPETTGKLTFPVGLKQPGPRTGPIQCYIRRNKSKSTYHLCLGLNPDNGKFLLAARRIRRPSHAEFIISMSAKDISSSSVSYMGKLRSNFLGTKFAIYDSQPPYKGAVASTGRSSRRFYYSRKVSPKVPSGNYGIAHIAYELNMLGTRGPRRMRCAMYSIPASALDPNGSVPYYDPTSNSLEAEESFSSISMSQPLDRVIGDLKLSESSRFSSSSRFTTSTRFTEVSVDIGGKDGPLVLKNKPPRWHEQLQCWCLNFRGRVTVASVKNFQLIAATGEPENPAPAAAPPANATAAAGGATTSQAAATTATGAGGSSSSSSDHEKIILQFGKIGKDLFTMDYRYPLSAFQAFAICLSSFDSKLACE